MRKKRGRYRESTSEHASRDSPHAAQPVFPEGIDGLLVRRVAEYRVASHQNACPRLRREAGRAAGDSAIDLEVDGATRPVDHVAYRSDLGEDLRQKGLTAKAGIDAHDEHKVACPDDVANRLLAGRRIEDDPGALAQVVNVLDGAIQVGGGFDMHAEHVGPRLGEVIEVLLRLDDHQMHVDPQSRCGSNGFHDRWTDGDVRNEASVHDVDVNPIGASGLDRANLLGQAPEISREN
jgi:hypothetical protein